MNGEGGANVDKLGELLGIMRKVRDGGGVGGRVKAWETTGVFKTVNVGGDGQCEGSV